VCPGIPESPRDPTVLGNLFEPGHCVLLPETPARIGGGLRESGAAKPQPGGGGGEPCRCLPLGGQPEKASVTYDQAINLALKELEVNPRNAAAMASLALYYAKKGNAPRASDFIRRARALDENNVEYMYSEAVVRTLAGRTQEAIQSLRRAFEKGYAVSDAMGNPELQKLQSLPEYQKLLAEFGQNDSKKPPGK
jgi:tetratricopeptide (TPR) repeat protein